MEIRPHFSPDWLEHRQEAGEINVLRIGDIPETKANLLIEHASPYLGSEVATYANAPWKAIHRAAVLQEAAIGLEVPDYLYSCPELDDKLFGKYPRTFYFDVGRGGPAFTLKKVFPYISYTHKTLANQPGAAFHNWNEHFGINSIVPLITRRSIYDWAHEQRASVYSVPATSIAEAFTSLVRLFPQFREEFSKLKGSDNWLSHGNDIREKSTSRLVTFLKQQLGPTNLQKLLEGNSKLSLDDLFNIVHKALFTMQIADFNKGDSVTMANESWAHRVYNYSSPTNHPGNGDSGNTSEKVVVGIADLSPIPWQGFMLFGDSFGSTRNQLQETANLVRFLYPEAFIYVLEGKDGASFVADDDKAQRALMATTTLVANYHLRPQINRDLRETVYPFI